MMKTILQIAIMICAFIAFSPQADSQDISIDTSSSLLYPGYSKKISMDFQDAALVDVLKIFSQQTNLNLISSEDLANKHITVYLDNVPVEQALEQVLRANNLTYELQPDSNIYIVKSITKPDTELLTRVYALKHASVSTARIKKTLKIVYNYSKDETHTVTEDDSSGSFGGNGSSGSSDTSGILSAIKGILTAKGKAVEDPRTNSLTITDVANNFNNIETAIAKLDIEVPQVLIEVEMLEVAKEDIDKLGVNYNGFFLSFNGGVSRDNIFPFTSKGFSSVVSGTNTVSNVMSALMEYLSSQTSTKNLARPRILTLNNQPAQIKISTQESIGTKQATTSSNGVTSASFEAERVETGVFLTVTPQVDLPNREITMAIVPKVITTRISTILDGNNHFFKDPEERGSLSIMRVKSGDTVVLGGLVREDRTTVINKIPLLSDIPVLGAAFRHKDDTIRNRELIIFLTPHILNDELSSETKKTAQLIREQNESQEHIETVEHELNKMQRKKL